MLDSSYRSTPLPPECLVRDCWNLHIPPGKVRENLGIESENGPGQKSPPVAVQEGFVDLLGSIVRILEPKRLRNGTLFGDFFEIRCKSENCAPVYMGANFSPSERVQIGSFFGPFSEIVPNDQEKSEVV